MTVEVAPQPPRIAGYVAVRPAVGGHSDEVFLAQDALTGRDVVLRVFGARQRGPEAPELQAAVLAKAGQLVTAPEVLEWRPATSTEPGLVATSALSGVVLDHVLSRSDDPALHHSLGRSLGSQLGRLSAQTLPIVGEFLDATLTRAYWQEGCESLEAWLEQWLPRPALAALSRRQLKNLRKACAQAEELLSVSQRACLVHGDLSPRNVLCDPATGEITGLFDWEFAHAGQPLEDTGHQLRERWQGPFANSLLDELNQHLPVREQAPREVLRLRARAADLYWIIELASRLGQGSATLRCHKILRAIALSGDLGATPS